MKKSLHRLLALLLSILMLIGLLPTAALADDTDGDDTAAAVIADGTYVIYNPAYEVALSSETTTNSLKKTYSAGAEITINDDGTISDYGSTEIWEISTDDEGTVTISQDGENLGASGTTYPIYAAGKNEEWSITVLDEDADEYGLINTSVSGTYTTYYLYWNFKLGNYFNLSTLSDDDLANEKYTFYEQAALCFYAVYEIEADEAENGSVEADADYAGEGESVTVTAEADDGYTVSSVTVTDEDGDEIEVTEAEDGTYSFTMPASGVTISVVFALEDEENEDDTSAAVVADGTYVIYNPAYGVALSSETTTNTLNKTYPAGTEITINADGTISGYSSVNIWTIENDTDAGTVSISQDGTKLGASKVTTPAWGAGTRETWSITVLDEDAGEYGIINEDASGTYTTYYLYWNYTLGNYFNLSTLTADDLANEKYTFYEQAALCFYAVYEIEADEAENGSVEADADYAGEGETVTVTADADDGYTVDSITVETEDGESVTVTENEDGTYSFTMPASAVTITAAFASESISDDDDDDDNEDNVLIPDGTYVIYNPAYTVALSSETTTNLLNKVYPAGTEITIDADGTISGYGSADIWTIENDTDAGTVSISQDGTKLGASTVYTPELGAGKRETWSITVLDEDEGEYGIINEDASGTYTTYYLYWNYTLGNYFNLSTLTADDLANESYTFYDQAALCFYAVYEIEAEEADNGSVSADADYAGEGETVTVTTDADDGYTVDSITVETEDGESVTVTENEDGTYSFTMPSSAVTVTVTFAQITCTLTYSANGGKGSMDSVTAAAGTSVTVSKNSFTRSGYTFKYWNTESDGSGTRYKVGATLTLDTDVTLYAQWSVIDYDYDDDDDDDDDDEDEDEDEDEDDDGDEDDETETLPTDEADTDETILFEDVSDDAAYYYDAVYWAVEQGITTGTTSSTYSPDLSITRKEVITMLYRLAGEPDAEGLTTAFTDISGTQYAAYYDAILWAESIGLTEGKGVETLFCPDDILTRAEAVTFLARYETLVAGGDSTAASIEEVFTDVTDPDKWYYEAVYWAYENGIVSGTAADTFSPDDACTRAQFVTFLYRYAG